MIADLDLDGAESFAKKLNEGAGSFRAAALRVDVISELDTQIMADKTVEIFGRIDVLLNNVGVYPHVAFQDISYEAWRQVLAINLDSIFLCSKAVLPSMKHQGGGKIINVASDLIWVGLPGMVHYTAAKSGIIGFTRSLAREMGMYGITVNTIAPGAVIPDIVLDPMSQNRMDAIINHQCIKRKLRPDDLVGPLIFLASSDSDFISAQILTVDGGLTTH